MGRLLVLAHLTLHEALRRRVLLAALLGGVAFLILYAIGFHFIVKDLAQNAKITLIERRVTLTAITLAGLYAVNLLSVMSAVLLPVDAISGEPIAGLPTRLSVPESGHCRLEHEYVLIQDVENDPEIGQYDRIAWLDAIPLAQRARGLVELLPTCVTRRDTKVNVRAGNA